MTPPLRSRRRWEVRHADCLTALAGIDAAMIDAVITDPPYGIGITGMAWDSPHKLSPKQPSERRSRIPQSVAYRQFCEQWGRECLRVLKPGAHLAAFSAPRTSHLLTSGLEDAGFEIRDLLVWLHSGGFPAARGLPGGFSTALRPAVEPIILARKPCEGTLGRNFATHGTGGLAIDACRQSHNCGGRHYDHHGASGRRPANVILCHDYACNSSRCDDNCAVNLLGERHRHFFCVKPSRRQREAGCERLPRRITQTFKLRPDQLPSAEANPVANFHPTVKPLDLMCWLVRLLTPHPLDREGARSYGAIVLDLFAGSGSTGCAAVLEGSRFLGIEREGAYVPIARARIKHWANPARRRQQ